MAFDDDFKLLVDNPPFPWQRALYERFVASNFPKACDLPIGLGKTSVIVPVPSIEPRGGAAETVGAVRRVMVFSTDVRSTDTAWAQRVLGGMDLIDE